MRTYTRTQLDEAEALWSDFSEEWEDWRRLAQRAGILYPPSGSVYDQWDDDHPTQRALIVRAMRETPVLLGWAINGVKAPSWSAVIGRLLSGRDEMREQIEEPESLDLTPSQSTRRISEILDVIRDS